ncbi:HTH domain-containing protein [Bacillus cereus]|uniref:HTH domain-containing protein n=1 Tax=Bacillus cereus TaxID=1396 RepID=UPI0030796B62
MSYEKDASVKGLSEKLIEKLEKRPDISVIELFSLYAYAVQNKFPKYIIAIKPSENTIFIEEVVYNDWTNSLNEIMKISNAPFVETIAKAKYYLEKIFFMHTKRGALDYVYHEEALLTSKELQQNLNVSRATISRYVDNGMEMVPGVGHRCYPLHNVFFWSNGIWAARIQTLYQSFKIRNRTKDDVISELKAEIAHFEAKYLSNFEDTFGYVQDPYKLDEPDDYFEWKDALEELRKLHE